MIRYAGSLNNTDKMVLHEIKEEFDYSAPYVVDDSNFVPISEAVRQLSGGNLSQDMVNMYYDFPTGKDTGENVPFSRTKECNDIAVLSSKINSDIADLADKISKTKKENAKRAAFEAELISASAGSDSTPKE